ncbi:MAG: helix-turn-helix domain-containing protein [Acidimicrobiales bacterium]
MDTLELAGVTGDPIQTLGMSYYFDPLTGERAKELGLNVFEFYGLGRGGTLGDVDSAAVVDAFTFFTPRTIDFLWTNAKTKADPVATAQAHLEAAYAFADRTFGQVDLGLLGAFGAAARKVADSVPARRCALVDGYRSFRAPADPVHAAYLGTILLRELRGGVHIHCVREVDLDPAAACFLQDATVFAMHGYHDDDAPEVSEELVEKKRRAEELTEAEMATYFSILSDPERATLLEGTRAMFDALANPVPVAH